MRQPQRLSLLLVLWLTVLVVWIDPVSAKYSGDDTLVQLETTASKNAEGEEETRYYSDISQQELSYGNWYHRWGENYDISASEWKALSRTQQDEFIPINSLQDVQGLKTEPILENIKFVPVSLNHAPTTPHHVAGGARKSNQHRGQPLQPNSNKHHKHHHHHHKHQVNQPNQQSLQQPKHSHNAVSTASRVHFKQNTAEVPKPSTTVPTLDSPKMSKKLLELLSSYKSSISGDKLKMGHWFHKVGRNYDITDREFLHIPREERDKYHRIDTLKDARELLELPELTQIKESSQQKEVMKFTSDISGRELTPGNWFHRLSGNYDVTKDEYEGLSDLEKKQYKKISTLKEAKNVEQQLRDAQNKIKPVVAPTVAVSNNKQGTEGRLQKLPASELVSIEASVVNPSPSTVEEQPQTQFTEQSETQPKLQQPTDNQQSEAQQQQQQSKPTENHQVEQSINLDQQLPPQDVNSEKDPLESSNSQEQASPAMSAEATTSTNIEDSQTDETLKLKPNQENLATEALVPSFKPEAKDDQKDATPASTKFQLKKPAVSINFSRQEEHKANTEQEIQLLTQTETKSGFHLAPVKYPKDNNMMKQDLGISKPQHSVVHIKRLENKVLVN